MQFACKVLEVKKVLYARLKLYSGMRYICCIYGQFLFCTGDLCNMTIFWQKNSPKVQLDELVS